MNIIYNIAVFPPRRLFWNRCSFTGPKIHRFAGFGLREKPDATYKFCLVQSCGFLVLRDFGEVKGGASFRHYFTTISWPLYAIINDTGKHGFSLSTAGLGPFQMQKDKMLLNMTTW